MALTIHTDSLKTLSNLLIECQLAQKLGLEVFNNMGTESDQYTELCSSLLESCNKIAEDLTKLKAAIPLKG